MSTIIIAAGGTPPDKKEFLDYAAVCDMIIAADSGADWLSCYGVTPNLLIGDFDSAKKTVISAYQIKGVKTITAKVEKDETDLMLAAQYAVKSNADKVIIFGGTGRRIDHLLGNFQVMYYLLKNNIRPIMIDRETMIEMMTSGKSVLVADIGATVSIVPYGGDARVTAESGGFKYPLDNLLLPADSPVGISNITRRTKISLKITGTVLIIVNR